jgi:hypothetical protein
LLRNETGWVFSADVSIFHSRANVPPILTVSPMRGKCGTFAVV